MTLAPFNEEATCAKCGGFLVLVRYVPPGRAYVCTVLECGAADVALQVPCIGGPACDLTHLSWVVAEHHHRVCDRCQYAWPEAVLPQIPGEAPAVPPAVQALVTNAAAAAVKAARDAA